MIMADSLEKEKCDYLQLRHVSVKQRPGETVTADDQVPRKTYKVRELARYLLMQPAVLTCTYVIDEIECTRVEVTILSAS